MENQWAYEQIKELLTEQQVNYKLLIHEPTKTSEESAKIRDAPLSSGAKAMLITNKKTNQTILFVMSAAKKLSWKSVRKIMDCKQIDLANEQQVFDITKCITGAVPPFGSIFNIKCYVDQSLIEQGQFINFNAGLRTHSISISVEDYLKIEKPELAQFCE